MARRFQPKEESQVTGLSEEENCLPETSVDVPQQSSETVSSDLNMLDRFLARFRSTPAGRLGVKIAITLLGTVIIAIGIVLLPLPGPGWVIIFTGLAVWSLEFRWARRLNRFVQREVGRWVRWYASQGWPIRIVVGFFTALFVFALVLLSLRISFGPDLFDRIRSVF